MTHPLAVTDATFASEVLNSPIPVVVDFWAPWCGPCRMIAPILDELASELAHKVKIVKINVDENPEVPSQFGISSIPTLLLFKGGNIVATKIGSVQKSKLLEWIQAA
jgi:thioredoxin 1